MKRIGKNIFDFVFSVIGFVILIPFFIIIGLIIILTSKGPALFRQVRIGKDEEPFEILKFRTMIVNAESMGLKITVGKDKRVTPIGEFLRKYKIDEFPQIINVLKGEMSFVGPRPEVPKYVSLYNEEQKRVLSIKPGITDLASIKFRKENELLSESQNPEKTYIEEIMPEKLRINLEYVNNASLWYDIKLIFNTIGSVFFNRKDKETDLS